jgi:hypothetical protein
MILGAVVLFVAVGVAMIVARRPLARWQGLLAGGTFPPALVIAEAAVLLAIAAAVMVAWRSGFFH